MHILLLGLLLWITDPPPLCIHNLNLKIISIASHGGAYVPHVFRGKKGMAYAKRLASLIENETSKVKDVHPLLIAAVIAKESSFNSRTRGREGEVGLMQLMPRFTQYFGCASTAGRHRLAKDEINIACGVKIISQLMKRCRGKLKNITDKMQVPRLALSAFNTGRCHSKHGAGYAERVISILGFSKGEE